MKKLQLGNFQFESKPEDRVRIIFEEGSTERTLKDFISLESYLADTERILLLPNKRILTEKQMISWFDRLTQYNSAIFKVPIVKRFLMDKSFNEVPQMSFMYQTMGKLYGKVENLLHSKEKFSG